MTGYAANSGKRHVFLPALGYPQYLLLWVSALTTWLGRWIETVVGAWLVLELTNSPFWVGLLGACRFAPMIIGPYCGTVCDRVNERAVLLTAQIVYGVCSLALMILAGFGRIEVWHIFLLSLIGGLCYTFDFSARYSVAAGIVESKHLVSSISLLQVASGVTGVLGPLVGGSLLEVIGRTYCFGLIAACFSISAAGLVPLKVGAKKVLPDRKSIASELLSGLRYIRGNRLLLALVILAAMVNFFIFPYSYTLLPIFARDILRTGSGGFGQLLASAGLGAIIGSLGIGAISRAKNLGSFLVIGLVAWPVLLVAWSFSDSFKISAALLMGAGVAQGIAMSLIQSLLMARSSEEMRGRVSGTRAAAICTLSLGNFLTGYEATFWSVPAVLTINVSVFLLATAWIVFWSRELVRDR